MDQDIAEISTETVIEFIESHVEDNGILPAFAWEEICRRARLGAAVEAMPHDIREHIKVCSKHIQTT